MIKYSINIAVLYLLFLNILNCNPTWKQVYSDNDSEIFLSISCADSLDCMALIDNSGLCRLIHTSDGGKTWSIVYEETSYSGISRVFNMQYPDKEHLFITYEQSTIKKTDYLFKSFDTFQLPYKNGLDLFKMIDSIHGMVVAPPRIFITSDGWKTQKYIDSKPIAGSVSAIWMHSINSFAYAGMPHENLSIYAKTTNGGLSWKVDSIFKGVIQKIFFLNENLGWMAGYEQNGKGDQSYDVIFKTADGGNKWNMIYYKENEPVFGLQDIAFTNENNGVAVGQFGKILRTKDGGNSWFREYYDGDQEPGPPTMVVTYAGNVPLIGTYGYGLFRLKDSLTDIVNYNNDNLPEESVSVFPNPFNNYLSFRFNRNFIGKYITVQIFDMFGKKITESGNLLLSDYTINEYLPGGLASGIYEYLIISDNNILSGKIIKE